MSSEASRGFNSGSYLYCRLLRNFHSLDEILIKSPTSAVGRPSEYFFLRQQGIIFTYLYVRELTPLLVV